MAANGIDILNYMQNSKIFQEFKRMTTPQHTHTTLLCQSISVRSIIFMENKYGTEPYYTKKTSCGTVSRSFLKETFKKRECDLYSVTLKFYVH